MKKTLFLIFIIGITTTTSLYSQPKGKLYLDSLLNEFDESRSDTSHNRLISLISFEYSFKNLDSARYYLHLLLNKSNNINDSVGIFTYYYQYGMVMMYKGEKDSVEANFKKADKLAALLNDTTNIIKVNNILGAYHYNIQNYPKSLEFFYKALNLAELSNNTSFIPALLNNIAPIEKFKMNYKRAIELIEKAIELNTETNNIAFLGVNYNLLGSIYFEIQEYEKSLNYYLKALEIYKASNNDLFSLGVYINVGLNYLELSDYDKAIQSINESIRLSENMDYISKETTGALLYSRLHYKLSQDSVLKKIEEQPLGFTFNKISNLRKSIKYSKIVIEEFKKSNNFIALTAQYRYLVMAYAELGDQGNEIKSQRELMKFTDSLYQRRMENNFESIEEERNRFKEERRKAIEEAKETARLRENNIIRYSASAGIAIVSFFSILFFRRMQKEKKLKENESKLKEQIQETHEETLSSIRYAKKIQSAILPWDSTIRNSLSDYFIFFSPKDIVSGDFYWHKQIGDDTYLAVADCTGHGIPGSMLSMMGLIILDEAVLNQKIDSPSKILNYLNIKMIEALNKEVDENDTHDGMDIVIVKLSKDKLYYSGAKRPLHYIQNNELTTIKGDRNSIAGETHTQDAFKFTEHELDIKTNTSFYLSSDGFVDQMGIDGKKFGSKKYREMIQRHSTLSMEEQGKNIENDFHKHKGGNNQRDDVTVIGFKVGM